LYIPKFHIILFQFQWDNLETLHNYQ
jgi:hypothetical protein